MIFFWFAQFMLGSPPSVEVQGLVVLLVFRGTLKEFCHFCVGVLYLLVVRERGGGFFLVDASFCRMRASISLAVWVK